jgi:hypothetical protein
MCKTQPVMRDVKIAITKFVLIRFAELCEMFKSGFPAVFYNLVGNSEIAGDSHPNSDVVDRSLGEQFDLGWGKERD